MRPGNSQQVRADYILAAVGREPNISFYSENLLKLRDKLAENGDLYEIGDLKNGLFRQVSIAVGDGVMAAMQIYNKFKAGNR